MGEASKEAELQQQAADRESAFNAKKKAKLEKPNAASDKGKPEEKIESALLQGTHCSYFTVACLSAVCPTLSLWRCHGPLLEN